MDRTPLRSSLSRVNFPQLHGTAYLEYKRVARNQLTETDLQKVSINVWRSVSVTQFLTATPRLLQSHSCTPVWASGAIRSVSSVTT